MFPYGCQQIESIIIFIETIRQLCFQPVVAVKYPNTIIMIFFGSVVCTDPNLLSSETVAKKSGLEELVGKVSVKFVTAKYDYVALDVCLTCGSFPVFGMFRVPKLHPIEAHRRQLCKREF